MELLFAGLIKLLGSAGFGTIFGGVMGFFNRQADLAYKKLEYADRDRQRAHERDQRKLDAELMDREWQGRAHVADIEAAGHIEEAGYAALVQSYKVAMPEKGSKIGQFSAFVRPFISISYFIVSTAGAGFILHYAFTQEYIRFSVDQWLTLTMLIIEWIMFMSGAAIGHWFAVRPGQMPRARR